MRDATAEKIEDVGVAEPLDVVDGRLKFHWTEVEKLPRILSTGFYSESFAKRIKDDEFKPLHERLHNEDKRYTHIAETPRPQIWELDIEKGVGIVVSDLRTRTVYLRMAPRKFVGLMIYDEDEKTDNGLATEEIITRRLDQVLQILNKEDVVLPVYGTSGNLYWPKRMTHDEIVRMLRERDGQSLS